MVCPDYNDLAAYVDQVLASAEGAVSVSPDVEEHLRTCQRCVLVVAGLLCEEKPHEEPKAIVAGSGLADTLFSARNAARLGLGMAEDGIRIEGIQSASLVTESLFGERFSVTRLMAHPVLPRQSFDVVFQSGDLARATFLPRPNGLALRLAVRENATVEEFEVYASGRLLRNAWREENGVFAFNNLPDGKTLIVRGAGQEEACLVLQCRVVVLDSHDYTRLAVFLASQGRLEEAADLFNRNNIAGRAGTRIARLYQLLRYGASLYPRELALLRKKRGQNNNRLCETSSAPLPVMEKIASRTEGAPAGSVTREMNEAVNAGLNGRWPEASRLFVRLAETTADPLLMAAAGWSALANDEPDRARELFAHALSLAPEQEDAAAGLEYANRIRQDRRPEENAEEVIGGWLKDYSALLEQEDDGMA